jgi:ABC-type polysaccharide/polyol phosphate transport system ATPase subunit
MSSTSSSEVLLRVSDLKVYYELDRYQPRDLRDVFVSAVSNPLRFLLQRSELYFVLRGVSFAVERGMRIGILGVNGSGKTTLCRCIAGMMVPQDGTIESRAEVRAIFDTGTGVMPELTGRENARLLARLFFPTTRDIDAIVDEAVEFSELGHFIDVPFKKYSKGMQSRLLLSLISAVPTDVLILDEVLDGADVFFQRKLSERMRSFIEKAGATIFVSHAPEQIRQVCNKVLVLNQGKVTFFGDVEPGIEAYLNLKTPA